MLFIWVFLIKWTIRYALRFIDGAVYYGLFVNVYIVDSLVIYISYDNHIKQEQINELIVYTGFRGQGLSAGASWLGSDSVQSRVKQCVKVAS